MDATPLFDIKRTVSPRTLSTSIVDPLISIESPSTLPRTVAHFDVSIVSAVRCREFIDTDWASTAVITSRSCQVDVTRTSTPAAQRMVQVVAELGSPPPALLASGASAFTTSGNALPAATRPQAAAQAPTMAVAGGINGFGRIGRQVVRIAMDRESFILKHINSPMAPEYMKYLLEHDTVHGRFSGTCEVAGDALDELDGDIDFNFEVEVKGGSIR